MVAGSSGGIQIHVDAAQSGVHYFSTHSHPSYLPTSGWLKVDGYTVTCIVGNGFPKPMVGGSLDADDAKTAGDGEPRRLPLEIRETAPGMGNVRRENEREPPPTPPNIERGLNSKISLSALSA
ncbi:hypothetical protein ALC56_05918 [Trachymyrmex septentrionalis]|uniref:Uncharacterized protein n=1 Tax=Trachymyrmex septentrionalis TaxID=34720 RepID=A0A195FFF0_9HYME|nr:hypothetical protein ALC56_05918 [Trachymyrmex septentrionalis]